ncbi:MAG: hypothetical protein JXA03_05905 [Bacteroidales bacterium]|nr:hypothetical protein [Bacteroidales bacterium]
MITYGSHYNSNFVIWIVNELRIEHENAIDWLNKNTNTDISFFIVRFELLSIGYSEPAPKFTLLLKPSSWVRKTFENQIETPPTREAFIQKSNIEIPSFIEFLDLYILKDKRYPRLTSKNGEFGLLSEYQKIFPKDSQFFDEHPKLFRKYLEIWADYKGYIINKKFQNKRFNGHDKSNGTYYYTFSEK